jgi:L-alanine-DL-glutamate epimerase-like enolase superfamily enzyme
VEERHHRDIFEGVFGGKSSSVVVEVELADGRAGRGEATLLPFWSGEAADASMILLQQVLGPALEGVEAAETAPAARAALAANNFLIWAVEAAALDALGVTATPKPVPVRGLIGRLPPDVAARLAELQTSEGHSRLKVKLTGDLSDDEARLWAVRGAAADAAIVADANEAIDREQLSSYAPVFRETAVAGVEQPCSRLAVLEHGLPPADGWAWVADESVWGYEDALRLRAGPWHTWTLHPGKCRGEDVLRRVAALAEQNGIAVVLGSNVEFGPGAAALCRVAAGLPESDLQRLLGHDLAGPLLVEDWSVSGLRLAGDSIHWKEEGS